MAELPVFFSEDGEALLAEAKTTMEGYLGRVIAPSDVEYLLLSGFCYMRNIDYIKSNAACRQNLLTYATGVQVDYLGELLGIYRLPASSAACTIRFVFQDGQPGLTMPAGVRIGATDQKAIFATTQITVVEAGTTSVDVPAICTETGTVGNSYDIGDISILFDPQPFCTGATNTDATTGGADIESDDELKKRIRLAPSQFSVAGPDEAYKAFAESANASIVDVAITSPEPGSVNIYALLEGGVIPGSEILAQILAVCNSQKVRPLTDTVVSLAPSKIDFTIEVELTLYDDAISDHVLETVNANLEIYKQARINKLGLDVVRSQIIGLCSIPGQVYDVAVISPADDIVAEKSEYTNCTGITVTVTGTNEG